MTYYLGKVGRAGARLVSSCKDLYNDVNAAYLTGATDVVVVKQKDGSLKSTPFHVRFGKLGVLRTGDLKEVEIEVNGSPVDMTMNIDETGKVFYTRLREGSDEEHVVIDMETEVPSGAQSGAQSGDEQESGLTVTSAGEDGQAADIMATPSSPPLLVSSVSTGSPLKDSSAATAPIPTPSSMPGRERIASSLPDSPAIAVETIPSDDLISSSLPYTLEVLSDSALETGAERTDGEDEVDGDRPTALSDTELEINERHSSWKHGSMRRKDITTKGEPSSQHMATTSDQDFKSRVQQQQALPTRPEDRSGFWNALTRMLKRRHSRRFSSVEDGIYLDDIDYDSMDPEELSKFFPSSNTDAVVTSGAATEPVGAPPPSQLEPTMGSSGLGSSPAFSLSPAHSTSDIQREGVKDNISQLVHTLDGVAFSLCGGLAQGTVTEDTFQNAFVSFSEFCGDPVAVLSSPNLVVRVNGKYYTWQVAAPLVMAAVVYLQVLPQKVQSKVTDKHMPKKHRQSFWNFWARGPKEEPEERAKSEGATPIGSPQKWTSGERRGVEPEKCRVEEKKQVSGEERGLGEGESAAAATGDSETVLPLGRVQVPLSSDDDSEGGGGREIAKRPRQRSKRSKKIGFTNVLTSEQLESLNLQDGPNKVVFSITTKYQGTAKAHCTVYLWNYTDKIVVSDIDGTITRSDVAGHLLPLLGMDWTQNGVVELFTAISKNGYNMVYLSARAIGQAGYTKDFLRKVRRGSHCLPDGPLFLFPFSLYKAFRKEVIERRPEEFKIDCLKQIRALFPEDFSPMHAGFGNRDNDVKSYMNVDIPESRIFTVNHKGIIRHELSLTFQSSYSSLMEFVDTQFPPLRCRLPSLSLDSCPDEEDTKEQYNTFNYWRTPVDLELPFDLDTM